MRIPREVGYVAQSLGQLPHVTPKDLAEIVALKGRIADADEREQGLTEEQKAKVMELKGLAGQEAGLYEEAAQRAYKVPERGRLGSKDFTTGLVFGGLQALTGPRGTAAGTVMSVLGPRKQRLDEQYADEKALLEGKMAEDERRLRLGVGALKARESGVAGELGLAGSELADVRGEARAMRGEQFQREQAAQAQSNIDRAFYADVAQRGFNNALASNADMRARAALELNQNPYRYVGEQAQTLAGLGFFGGDIEKARQAVASSLIVGQANAEWTPRLLAQQFGLNETNAQAAQEELKKLQTLNKYLPEQIRSDLASAALGRASTSQAMAARAIDIENARKAGDARQLTVLESAQIKDAEETIASLRQSVQSARLELAKAQGTTGQAEATKSINALIANYEEGIKAAQEERKRLLGGG